MLRSHTYQRAVLVAVIAILLCLSCLSGATYALFTNDLNDGTIGIVTTAGEVKVDIVDLDGVTLVGSTLDFQTDLEQDSVFFEPGAVFVTEGFKVENKGDVTINFKISVSADEKIDMEEFSEAFELWITTDPTAYTDADRLQSFKGSLSPQGLTSLSETYYLFIRMRETAGNTFQGVSYDGIGVTVYAVQGNVEIKE